MYGALLQTCKIQKKYKKYQTSTIIKYNHFNAHKIQFVINIYQISNKNKQDQLHMRCMNIYINTKFNNKRHYMSLNKSKP